jgi:hypothetical protein
LEHTLDAFILAFATRGYQLCDAPDAEDGYEKIAIYVDADGKPTHAARQVMPSGKWASKLGSWEDIIHFTLGGVEGADYGSAAKFLKRKITESFTPKCLPEISGDGDVSKEVANKQ